MEQNQTQDEVQRERAQREKLGREKDVLTGEVFTIRQQLQVRCVCVHVCLTPPTDLIDHRIAPIGVMGANIYSVLKMKKECEISVQNENRTKLQGKRIETCMCVGQGAGAVWDEGKAGAARGRATGSLLSGVEGRGIAGQAEKAAT